MKYFDKQDNFKTLKRLIFLHSHIIWDFLIYLNEYTTDTCKVRTNNFRTPCVHEYKVRHTKACIN